MDVLARTTPLAHAVANQKVIHPAHGGTISLPGAGIAIHIPAGAIAEDVYGAEVVIGMEAYAGDRVAFEFYPHGIQFNKPVTIRIDVTGTEAEFLETQHYPNGILNNFLGVYYHGDGAAGNVDAVETFPVFYGNGKLVFQTDHFSGYAIAF